MIIFDKKEASGTEIYNHAFRQNAKRNEDLDISFYTARTGSHF